MPQRYEENAAARSAGEGAQQARERDRGPLATTVRDSRCARWSVAIVVRCRTCAQYRRADVEAACPPSWNVSAATTLQNIFERLYAIDPKTRRPEAIPVFLSLVQRWNIL